MMIGNMINIATLRLSGKIYRKGAMAQSKI